jgi:plastocyanin
MKKFLILALAIGFITTCNNKKEENDEDAIIALALSQLNQLPSTCDVDVSIGSQKYNERNIPITYSSPTAAQTVSKTAVLDSNGTKVKDHVIGVVSLTANIGTTITLAGTGNGTHYVILYEKGAGCPIGTADDIGNITNKSDFTVTGISNNSITQNLNYASAAATVKFNKAGRYFYIVYQGTDISAAPKDVTVITTVQ